MGGLQPRLRGFVGNGSRRAIRPVQTLEDRVAVHIDLLDAPVEPQARGLGADGNAQGLQGDRQLHGIAGRIFSGSLDRDPDVVQHAHVVEPRLRDLGPGLPRRVIAGVRGNRPVEHGDRLAFERGDHQPLIPGNGDVARGLHLHVGAEHQIDDRAAFEQATPVGAFVQERPAVPDLP